MWDCIFNVKNWKEYCYSCVGSYMITISIPENINTPYDNTLTVETSEPQFHKSNNCWPYNYLNGHKWAWASASHEAGGFVPPWVPLKPTGSHSPHRSCPWAPGSLGKGDTHFGTSQDLANLSVSQFCFLSYWLILRQALPLSC